MKLDTFYEFSPGMTPYEMIKVMEILNSKLVAQIGRQ